jgi:hypothetical protein
MHINALLTFAELKRMQDDLRYIARTGNLTELGKILLAENERSVLHRYPDCTEADMPGTIGQEAIGYAFKTWGQAFRLPHDKLCIWIIKACDCFDYQACETDDYEQSLAFKIITAIRSRAWHSMQAYDAAPWGIDKDEGPQVVSLNSLSSRMRSAND